jgi:hypothetical protein
VFWQLRAPYPLMNMRLYSYRQFSAGAIVAFIYGAGLFGSTYLLPVYMQMALSYTPSAAGIVLMPAGVALAVTIAVAGRLTSRVPPHRQVSFGLALLAGSFLLMATGSTATPYLLLVLICGDRPDRLGCPALADDGLDARGGFLDDRAGLELHQLRAATGRGDRRESGWSGAAMAPCRTRCRAWQGW